MIAPSFRLRFLDRAGCTSKGKGFSSDSVLVLVLLSFLGLVACAEKDDTEAVRALMERGAALAEQHDIGALMDLCSEDFRAEPGGLDRNGAKGVLWRAFQYYRDFKVLYPRPSVKVSEDGEDASARCPFLIVRSETTVPKLQELYEDPRAWVQEVGEKADLYCLTLGLQKKGDDWLVQGARIERFTGVGFDS
jgi:hypothetical protein